MWFFVAQHQSNVHQKGGAKLNQNIGICNADYLMGEVDKDQNYALEKIKDYHRSQGDNILPWTSMEQKG